MCLHIYVDMSDIYPSTRVRLICWFYVVWYVPMIMCYWLFAVASFSF